jgi:glycosyltransferase involved in cell wall biosynthesis
MGKRRKRIVWLFDGDHLTHPFICLGVETLRAAGHTVSVVDRADEARETPYDRVALKYPDPLYADIRFWGRRDRLRANRYLASLFWQTLVRRPSVIIATLPTAAVMGWRAARLLRARLVYYPFELYGEQHYKVSPHWKAQEVALLREGIDALITQNDGRARIYREERGARVAPTIVHNYKPRRADVERSGKLRGLLGLPPERRIVLYEGELTYGRWLAELIESVRHLPEDVALVFLGRKTPWWEENAEPLRNVPGIAGRTYVAPFVPHAELPGYVADADVGVIIYDDQVRNNVNCEPGKLSDYVLANVPVVAPDFPTIAPRVRQHGVGATFAGGTPEEIACAITNALNTPRAVWDAALAKAKEELVWETQAPAFLRAVTGG